MPPLLAVETPPVALAESAAKASVAASTAAATATDGPDGGTADAAGLLAGRLTAVARLARDVFERTAAHATRVWTCALRSAAAPSRSVAARAALGSRMVAPVFVAVVTPDR
jgi:hypothetical protein